jgi:hypothetical protein
MAEVHIHLVLAGKGREAFMRSFRPVRDRLRRRPPLGSVRNEEFEIVAVLAADAIEVVEVEGSVNGRQCGRRLQLRIATDTTHITVEIRRPDDLLADVVEATEWWREGH